MKKRILSGIQPSGELHLGNYFGMMSRMIEYQEKNDLFCCIVNLHALTTIDGKSILSLMMLAATKGTVLKIETEGIDEDIAIEAIINLVKSGFDEVN